MMFEIIRTRSHRAEVVKHWIKTVQSGVLNIISEYHHTD